MKYPKFYILFLLVHISCNSFKKEPENLTKNDFKTITINNDYSLNLPKYLSEGELHEEASLQYQHMFKETYVIVIDENIQEAKTSLQYYNTFSNDKTFIDNYIDFQKDGFKDTSEVITMGDINNISINGLNAKQFNMVLKIPDLDEHIAYLVTFIQSQERIYMLMSWTLKSRSQRYMDTFKAIATSFQVKQKRSKTKRK